MRLLIAIMCLLTMQINVIASQDHKCSECNRCFTTLLGLGLHKSKIHGIIKEEKSSKGKNFQMEKFNI